MKKTSVFLVLILVLFMFFSVYALTNGVCERDKGESCVNSKDCTICLIRIYPTLEDFGKFKTLNVLVKSEEPAKLELELLVKADDRIVYSKTFEIDPLGTKTFNIELDKWLDGKDVFVEIVDPKTSKLYAYETLFVKGSNNFNDLVLWLIYIAIALLVAFGMVVLFFYLNKKNKIEKYNIPVYQVGETTSVPSQYMYIPVVVSPSTVLVKKKKYYYTKRE